MAADDKVSVEISIEERAALKALTALTKGLDKFEKQAVESTKKSDAAFDSFKGNLAAIATSGVLRAIAGGIRELVVGSLEAAAAAEKLTTQFEVLTGSTETATALFKELKDFSASTPFQLQDIAAASGQLLSFGFAADEVRERIERIGEVAAGSNSQLKEVALIYGQVAAAGKLTGERLLQFQERAIPIGAALAETFGVAESAVKDLVSQGVVGFAEFEDAFNSMSESGGLFEGAIAKQSKTVNGALSTLSDNFSILQSTIGDTFKDDFVVGVQTLTKALQSLIVAVKENEAVFQSIGEFLKDYAVTYLTIAENAIKAEKPIDLVNEAIKENVEQAQQLADRLATLEGRRGSYFGLFDSADEQLINKVTASIKNNRAELQLLIRDRKILIDQGAKFGKALAAGAGASLVGIDFSKLSEPAKETNQKILEDRAKLNEELLGLQQDLFIRESEAKLAQTTLTADERVNELEYIRAFEIEKADIALEAELEKNKKIIDARNKALADQKAFAKNELAIRTAQAKAEKQIQDARVKNEQMMVQGFGTALSQAASLAKKGTAEQKVFATAAATINTYAAATRAYRDYPYPANIAVMATTIAAGLAQVKEITKASFATGGVVGGFAGASMGADNTNANVRSGEMILNANQQRRLFDIAAGNENTEPQAQVIEVTSIVQVDEREIARAVRNQRLNGFNI